MGEEEPQPNPILNPADARQSAGKYLQETEKQEKQEKLMQVLSKEAGVTKEKEGEGERVEGKGGKGKGRKQKGKKRGITHHSPPPTP